MRFASVFGGLFFSALSLKMGAEFFHGRSTSSALCIWKRGTMRDEDGFKLTAIFAVHAAVWFYFATQ